MKKRWFAVMSILLLSVGMIAGCARSAKEAPTAENPLILKIGVSTADADPRNIAAKQFAEEIANSTGGVILATVSGGGVLGDDAALIDAVSLGSGKVDIVISDASNFANYEPRMTLIRHGHSWTVISKRVRRRDCQSTISGCLRTTATASAA